MADNFKLSNNEVSVLRQLESDGRIPFSKIGKKTRKSQQRVSYTVNSLINKEVIKNFYTLIDYSKLGVLSFRVYFKINYLSGEKFKELIKHLMYLTNTGWIATCEGDFDLICTFFAFNPSQFNKNLRKVMAKFPDQIRDHTVLTTIVIRNFEREYLVNTPNIPKEAIIGGDRKPEQVDDTDMQILSLISDDARVSSVELGSKLSLTPKTVITRLKKLEEKRVIRGYRPLLDLNKTGHTLILLLIKYHNITLGVENKLINYLKLHPNVLGIVKTLGEWDLEIEIEVKNMRDFRKIGIEIRQKFTTMIQQTRSIPLDETFKKSFFPKFLIENI